MFYKKIIVSIVSIFCLFEGAWVRAEITSAHDFEKKIKNAALKWKYLHLGLQGPAEQGSGGFATDVMSHSVFFFEIKNDWTQTIRSTGAIFTYFPRSAGGPGQPHPQLGPGWSAPNGMVWFDTLLDENQQPLERIQSDAENECLDRGARLPTKKEVIQFREYLGFEFDQGYEIPSIFSDLEVEDSSFWTSSGKKRTPDWAFSLEGPSGSIDLDSSSIERFIRCVYVAPEY